MGLRLEAEKLTAALVKATGRPADAFISALAAGISAALAGVTIPGGGGGGSVNSVTAGDGTTVTGTATDPVVNVDGTVLRTSGSYSNPSWLASLAAVKLTGALPAISGALLTALDPTHIAAGTAGISISGNAATATSAGSATTAGSAASVPAAGVGAGTAGIDISGNAATASAAATVPASGISGAVSLAHGGSGADLSATGGANQLVRQDSAGGVFTVGALAAADLSGVSGAGLADLTVPVLLVGTQTLTDGSTHILWSGYLDSADYPAGRDIKLAITGSVSRSGPSGDFILWDVAAAAAVASTVSLTSTSTAQPTPPTVTLGSGNKLYELKATLTGYASAPDALNLLSAILVVR